MHLDEGSRYLLSRPRGGFNDAMVQVEKSILYAIKYDRVLVLDTSRSGFREQFDAIFDFTSDFAGKVIPWDPSMAEAFDSEASVHPAELRHRISTYETTWHTDKNYYSDTQSGCAINFDHSRDYNQKVLVYEQAGSGYASFYALKRLVLRPDVANEIATRLSKLGSGFDAVHIRHTDYETDFEAFLRKLRPVLRGRRVVICSDNLEAKHAATSILHPSTTTLSVGDVPDIGGAPLHSTDGIDYHSANIDLLSDLIAMSLADNFYFTRLSGGNGNGVKYSGFSLLAELLGRDPQTVSQLLSAADPKVVGSLFERPSASFNLMRFLHVLDCYRWNFRAKRKAFKRNRRAVKRRLTPEKIRPNYYDS